MAAMTLSGEQWLDRVFRPAVAVVNRARHDRVPIEPMRMLGGRLAAQVEALADTGVLTEAQERAAFSALDEAGIMPETRSQSTSFSTSSVTAPVAARTGSAAGAVEEPPALRNVLAGPRQLGEIDGRPVTLISAELWNDRFLVDLYTDPGPEYRATRSRATREQLEWMRDQRRGLAGDRPGPARAGSPLQDLTWELRDEHGTAFRQTGTSTESGHYLDRRQMQWSPAPTSAQLTLLATDATGAVVLNAELPGPA